MRRKLSLLFFALALAAIGIGGLSTPPALASCTQHCELISCGFECCTYTNCTTHCFNVFCGG